MSKELLAGIAEAVEMDEVTPDTVLESCPEWNSIAVVVVMGLLDERGVEVDGKAVQQCKTVADILALAGVTA